MGEARAQLVTIEDMQPVFQALVHFIYTFSLPAMDDQEEDDKTEMIWYLLVTFEELIVLERATSSS
jgi:speckle-type POZ protein